jgi:hypothetical protein
VVLRTRAELSGRGGCAEAGTAALGANLLGGMRA